MEKDLGWAPKGRVRVEVLAHREQLHEVVARVVEGQGAQPLVRVDLRDVPVGEGLVVLAAPLVAPGAAAEGRCLVEDLLEAARERVAAGARSRLSGYRTHRGWLPLAR